MIINNNNNHVNTFLLFIIFNKVLLLILSKLKYNPMFVIIMLLTLLHQIRTIRLSYERRFYYSFYFYT